MKSALITGVLGQDGTFLARWLASKGYAVHGLIRRGIQKERARIEARFPPAVRKNFRFHTATLEDGRSLRRAIEAADPDELYHLAGVTDSRHSFIVPEETIESITLGTLRLLEACRCSQKGIRVFLASSCEVFGVPQATPQTMSTPRQPLTPYGIAKDAADRLAWLYRQRYNQFIATGILYNHESPLRPSNYLSARVAKAVAAIKAGTQHELKLGTLNAQRDWGDARDFVRGFHLALQSDRPRDYIFASGRSHTVADLAETAFAAAGLDYRDFVRIETAQVGVVPVSEGLCGEIRRTVRVLGWKPEWAFEETISDMVQAELEQRPLHARSDPYPSVSKTFSDGSPSRHSPRQKRLDPGG